MRGTHARHLVPRFSLCASYLLCSAHCLPTYYLLPYIILKSQSKYTTPVTSHLRPDIDLQVAQLGHCPGRAAGSDVLGPRLCTRVLFLQSS
ncbi:hypothetical protein EXIGLDRAFT_52044 [Exidia glandulosa HHB12029]|uniref:Uncharacterized protein n=1 Tax=Exidia glandulosa HHB12029 TaxID=1314781 RepID=A0A166MQ16_EXIGL|nr:hypothetical protein EXIGLDRAFT_52044 [Exidia glandulosa HHB12029]